MSYGALMQCSGRLDSLIDKMAAADNSTGDLVSMEKKTIDTASPDSANTGMSQKQVADVSVNKNDYVTAGVMTSPTGEVANRTQKTDILSYALKAAEWLSRSDKTAGKKSPINEELPKQLLRKTGEEALADGNLDAALEAASAFNALDAAEKIGEDLEAKVAVMKHFTYLEDMGQIKSASALFSDWLFNDKTAQYWNGMWPADQEINEEDGEQHYKQTTGWNYDNNGSYTSPDTTAYGKAHYPYLGRDKRAGMEWSDWGHKLKDSVPGILGGAAMLGAGLARPQWMGQVARRALLAGGGTALGLGVLPAAEHRGGMSRLYNLAVRNPLTTGLLTGGTTAAAHSQALHRARPNASPQAARGGSPVPSPVPLEEILTPSIMTGAGLAGAGINEYNRPNSWIRDLTGGTNRTVLPTWHPGSWLHRDGYVHPATAGLLGAAAGAGGQYLADRYLFGKKSSPMDLVLTGTAGGLTGAGLGHLYNQYNVDYDKVRRPVR